MSIGWYVGNANDDAGTNRGWLLGHFMSDEVRNTDAVEVKWGIHPAGQRRDGWTATEQRTTLLLLISGRFRLDLPTGSVTLERQGVSCGERASTTPGKPRTTRPSSRFAGHHGRSRCSGRGLT